MTFAIVTDTANDLPIEVVEKYNLHLVQTKISFGDETLSDNEITIEEMLDRFNRGEYARTSLPSPGDFVEVYEEAKKESNSILSIHVSSKLSGILNSANSASQYVENADIHLFDTLNISIGSGYFAALAGFLRDNGFSLEKTVETMTQTRDKMHIEVYIDDVDYLRRGGRVNTAQFAFLKIFNFKPLLQCNDGRLELQGIGFGRKGSLKKISKKILKIYDEYESPMLIVGASNRKEDIDLLWGYLGELYNDNDENKMELIIGSTLISHTGPNSSGIGIAPSFNSFIK